VRIVGPDAVAGATEGAAAVGVGSAILVWRRERKEVQVEVGG
jgi:hypothetical protein